MFSLRVSISINYLVTQIFIFTEETSFITLYHNPQNLVFIYLLMLQLPEKNPNLYSSTWPSNIDIFISIWLQRKTWIICDSSLNSNHYIQFKTKLLILSLKYMLISDVLLYLCCRNLYHLTILSELLGYPIKLLLLLLCAINFWV